MDAIDAMDAMEDKHLREETLSSQPLLNSHFLQVLGDTVRLPDGRTATRDYIVHPGAVMVIPLLDQPSGTPRLVLERQFRYPVERVMIEFPAGKLDSGEDCLACARRELREETGYTAHEWARAGVIVKIVCQLLIHIFVWRLCVGQKIH